MEAFGTLGGGQVRYLKTTNPLGPPYYLSRFRHLFGGLRGREKTFLGYDRH